MRPEPGPPRSLPRLGGLLGLAALLVIVSGPLALAAATSDGLLDGDGVRMGFAVWLLAPLVLIVFGYLASTADRTTTVDGALGSCIKAAAGAAALGLGLVFPALLTSGLVLLVFAFAAAAFAIGSVGGAGALVESGLAGNPRASAEHWQPLGFFVVGLPLFFATLFAVPEDPTALRAAVAAAACEVPAFTPGPAAPPTALDEFTARVVAVAIPLALVACAAFGLRISRRRAAQADRDPLTPGPCVLHGRLVAADDDDRPVEVEVERIVTPDNKYPPPRYHAAPFVLLRDDGTRVRVEPGEDIDLGGFPGLYVAQGAARHHLEPRVPAYVTGRLTVRAGEPTTAAWVLVPLPGGLLRVGTGPPSGVPADRPWRHGSGLVLGLLVLMIVNVGLVRRYHLLRVGPTATTVGVAAAEQVRTWKSSKGGGSSRMVLVRYRDPTGEVRELALRDGEPVRPCEPVPLVVSRRLPGIAERGPAPGIGPVTTALTWSFVLLGLAAYGLLVGNSRRPRLE